MRMKIFLKKVLSAWLRAHHSKPRTMIPTTDQRSTSVGDLAVVCYENTKGNGYKEVVYRADNIGWSKWFGSQHIDNSSEKYLGGA